MGWLSSKTRWLLETKTIDRFHLMAKQSQSQKGKPKGKIEQTSWILKAWSGEREGRTSKKIFRRNWTHQLPHYLFE